MLELTKPVNPANREATTTSNAINKLIAMKILVFNLGFIIQICHNGLV